MNIPLIQTIGLKKYFRVCRLLHAVDGVNLTVKGETLGIVGAGNQPSEDW